MGQKEDKMLAPGQSLRSGPPPASSQPTPSRPFLQAFFFLPAHSPSVKPCPEADLLQRTASLREPFLSEKPHRGMLLMLAGPAVTVCHHGFLSPPPASSAVSFVSFEQEGKGKGKGPCVTRFLQQCSFSSLPQAHFCRR